MKKIYTKLIVIVLALILTISVIAVSSYAWLVLSSNPAVEGIDISIGGGNTILIAADMTETVDGETVHYPDYFSDTLNFSQHRSYAYLSELGGLTPVSTADGVHWFLPTYYDASDEEVQAGQVPSGALKDVSEFWSDDYLQYANLTADQGERIAEGSYIYLDFWVVSPQGDYTLRVSTGDDSSGSFLVELPGVTAGDDGYTLEQTDGSAAACARVGFLANTITTGDAAMDAYEEAFSYDDRYTALRGVYQEKTNYGAEYSETRFTIYEPNGDLHPDNEWLARNYAFTKPVGMVDGKGAEVSVADRLTVQLTSDWAMDEEVGQTQLEQRFQAALIGMTERGSMSLGDITQRFYGSYLQGQLTPYVDKGDFVRRTADLYAHTGKVSAQQLAAVETAGATEDVYIVRLEENVPQRIRMFIWLEGQDADCADGVDASRIAVNIELAGGNE